MLPCRKLGSCASLWCACTVLLVRTAPGQAAPIDSQIERHIRNVVGGLLIETAVNGVYKSGTLQDRLAFYHTPGVSVAVVNDYHLEWARGFGVQEAGTRRLVDTRTRFQAGSVSKPTFAVVVMRLVEQGRLSLDEDVNEYLTTWKIPPVGDWQPRVTLRQLFGHAAGFTVHGFLGYARSQPIPTIPQILDGLPPANSPPIRMNIVPGLQSRYSGGGVTIAQLAVTDHIGRPLPALAKDLVFDRLGMNRSGYDQPLRDTIDVATGHYWMARPLSGRWHTYPELAAAGLWTTPSDLARLGASLERALRGDTNDVLMPTSARVMVTSQHLVGDDIGISFFLDGQGDSARFSHSGWDEGFLTSFVMYVRGGYGAVVMVNSTEGGDLSDEILRSIATEYHWPGYMVRPTVIRKLDPAVNARFAGSYALADGTRITIDDRAGELWLTLPNQPAAHLSATSDSSFVIPGLNMSATVTAPDSSKRVLILQQEGTTIRAERQSAQALRPN